MTKHFLSALLLATLSSCGTYTKYSHETEVPEKLFGDSVLTQSIEEYEDTTSLGQTDWHEIFSDTLLQGYIEQALQRNTDLQQAELRVEEAAATLKASKLAYAPSFSLSPQAGVSSFGGAKASQTWSVPLNMSWEIDIFGRMRNAKAQAQALYAKSRDYKQAVRTQLVANVASLYYSLVALDRQLALSKETEEAWQETLVTARALMKAGRYDEAGVSQMDATLQSVHTAVLDLQSQTTQTENALAVILCETPRHYARGSEITLCVDKLSAGVPLQLLAARPDVRQAEHAVEAAFYGVNQARSAFYPQLTLSGSVGWTNSAGSAIVNPGRFLASALASLVAPLFTKGQNEAQLRIAKAQREEAKLSFTQTLLNAGKEVNDALTAYQTAAEKEQTLVTQIAALEKALKSTTLLMDHGTNTYLEVLTARQSLYSAQLTEVTNQLSKAQQLINLYQALGGGQEKGA